MDVQKYLNRIGLDSAGEIDVASLERLQRAHLTAVPFENLDVFRRHGVRTDTDWSIRKIVDRSRGGWCFELNGAFAALLEAIGYQVTRLGAVVLLEGDDGHASHLALRVDLAEPYLVDVGFGDGFIRPLALDRPGPLDGGSGTYCFTSSGGQMTLQEIDAQGVLKPIYRFTLEPRSLASFDGQSNRLQTDSTLKWTKARFATRLLKGGPDRVTLVSDRLRFRRGGVWHEQPVAEEDWATELQTWFGLSTD